MPYTGHNSRLHLSFSCSFHLHRPFSKNRKKPSNTLPKHLAKEENSDTEISNFIGIICNLNVTPFIPEGSHVIGGEPIAIHWALDTILDSVLLLRIFWKTEKNLVILCPTRDPLFSSLALATTRPTRQSNYIYD
ncbi:hypothetical protein SFRURICE_000124 [Spodoptera frugiperda]|nr:hypothetical protein SFRURICE_000124 [Spodoptera frugiperda]